MITIKNDKASSKTEHNSAKKTMFIWHTNWYKVPLLQRF